MLLREIPSHLGLRYNPGPRCKLRAVFASEESDWGLRGVRMTSYCQRPYCLENTGSHPNSEVKQGKARIVLGWVTAREVLRVLLAFWVVKELRIVG